MRVSLTTEADSGCVVVNAYLGLPIDPGIIGLKEPPSDSLPTYSDR